MVIDVFSKFRWIVPLKDKTVASALKKSIDLLITVASALKKSSKKKESQNSYELIREKNFTTKIQKACWTNTPLNCIQLKMKKKVLLLNAGVALSKIKCGTNLQNKVQLST